MTLFRLFRHITAVFALIGLAYGQSPVTPQELHSCTVSDITQDFKKLNDAHELIRGSLSEYTFTLTSDAWTSQTYVEIAVYTVGGTYVGHIKCIMDSTRYYVALLELEPAFQRKNIGGLLLTWAKQQAQNHKLHLDLIAYPFLHASPQDVPQEERVKRLDKLVTFYKKHGGIERSRNLAGYTAQIEFPYAIQM